MPFIANTPDDQQQMLKSIGVKTFDDLISNIPRDSLLTKELDLPAPLSELEVKRHLQEIANLNKNCQEYTCFLGGGAYDHFVPAAVQEILNRSEFYTAYTPYQPEVSQGTLQSIYEYQSMVCELTAMDVSNASMYDGGSAVAEAVLLAAGHTRRKKIVLTSTLHPNYSNIIKTYCYGQDIQLDIVDWQDGGVDLNKLKDTVDGETAAVVIQHPNYWGYLEDMESIASITHREGALLITSNDPISLALLKPPGEYGVDIATGEGQSLGNELNFGGPYLGIFTTKQELVRKIPGRIVGQTVDKNGKPGFVLTLQTREQHIRRERATSNICTNQGLNALAACIYLALMGKNGIYNIANLCLQKSHYLAQRITNIDGFNLKFNRPFFKEFVIETEKPVKDILDKLLENNIFGGINLKPQLKNCFLCCVTEKRTKKEIDTLVEILDSV